MSLNPPNCRLAPEFQRLLLDLARDSIRFGLDAGRPLRVPIDRLPEELQTVRATFVTLEKAGALRGCIGCLEARRPLAADIAANAYAAAFEDPRFPAVTPCEVDRLEIHLSLLTPAEPIAALSEADLIQQLRPGEDGLILAEGTRRGTFLPSVWETLPEPRNFIRRLKIKAGLPADYWSDGLKVYRYRTELIREAELGPDGAHVPAAV